MENTMQLYLGFLVCIVWCFTCPGNARFGENAMAPSPAQPPAEPPSGGEDPKKTFNVLDFGAQGDGNSDDSEAFLAAFGKACKYKSGVLLVPQGYTFQLQTIEFNGKSCQSKFIFHLEGKILAPHKSGLMKPDFQWIKFSNFKNGLIIRGKGVIDGYGHSWWEANGDRPNAVRISDSTNVDLSKITVTNSPMFHIYIEACTYVNIKGVTVNSPEDSPNTDGIHLTNTQHAKISHCIIAAGDDCVSLQKGVSDVKIHNVRCGPGHGYSIGGLGPKQGHAEVSDVHVYDSSVSNAMTGVRIKTWQGGSGSVSNISFANIEMDNVKVPIMIDQFYCGGARDCPAPTHENIVINGVSYTEITGTYKHQAVHLRCNEKHPCTNLEFDTINLTPLESDSTRAATNCTNAYGRQLTETTPSLDDCLLS